jgi:predicted lactoylglutathione lyase
MLIDPNLVVFYVESPTNSAEFYSELLETQPIFSSPTYVMFLLKTGLRLGLWSKHEVKPQVSSTGGGSELSFQVANDETVDEFYTKWQQKKYPILQPPTMMDFGYTFVVLDPDNHRLRICSLKENPM